MGREQDTTGTKTATELFTFEGGDILISVTYKGEAITGKVFSGAMVMASPVWKYFIFSPFLQNNNTAICDEGRAVPKPAFSGPHVETLDFSEDDGEALLILLRLAHMQFRLIPSTINTTLFRDVAILCDLYDCGMLLSLPL